MREDRRKIPRALPLLRNLPCTLLATAMQRSQCARFLPQRQATGEKPASVEHLVKQGETLYSIAHAYKTSVENIRQANSFLVERPLRAGDVLTIQR